MSDWQEEALKRERQTATKMFKWERLPARDRRELRSARKQMNQYRHLMSYWAARGDAKTSEIMRAIVTINRRAVRKRLRHKRLMMGE